MSHSSAATIRALALAPAVALLASCTMGSQSANSASARVSTTATSGAGTGKSAPASMSPTTKEASPRGMPTAKEAFSKTQDRIAQYTSLTYKGKGTIDKVPATTTVSGDLDGEPMRAVITTPTEGVLELRRLSSDMYIHGDEKYWTKVIQATKRKADPNTLSKKWFESDASKFDKKDLNDLQIDDLLDHVTDDNRDQSRSLLSDRATITKEKLNGKDAYKIVGDDHKTTVWTTTDGKYDLLKLSGLPSTVNYSEITFSDWNKSFHIAAPSGAEDLGHRPGSSSSPTPSSSSTSSSTAKT